MWMPEDEKEQERRALLEASESPVGLPPRTPAVDPTAEQPDAVAPDAPVESAPVAPVESAPVAPVESAPVAPPIDLAAEERAAQTRYDENLSRGRAATDAANLRAGIAQAGEMLNQAFAGGPQVKQIDPFFNWLRDRAALPEQRAEKDADRALRMDLQRLRTLKADKEVDDPSSAANRAFQAAIAKDWIAAGKDPGLLSTLTQKQILESLKGGKLVTSGLQADRSLNLRERGVEHAERMGEAKLKSDEFKNSLAQMGFDRDSQEIVSKRLQGFGKEVEKEQNVAASLEVVADALKPFQDPNSPIPLPSLAESAANKYLLGFGRLLAEGQNRGQAAQLDQAFQQLINAEAHRLYGSALTANEQKRFEAATAAGVGGSWTAKLEYLALVSKALQKYLRNREVGFQLPPNVWQEAAQAGQYNSYHPLFGGAPAVNVPGQRFEGAPQAPDLTGEGSVPQSAPPLPTSQPVVEPSAGNPFMKPTTGGLNILPPKGAAPRPAPQSSAPAAAGRLSPEEQAELDRLRAKYRK